MNQEQKNKMDMFNKDQNKRGIKKALDIAEKRSKNGKVKLILKIIKVVWKPLLIISCISTLVLITCFLKILGYEFESTNDAKEKGLQTAYVKVTSDKDTKNKVVVQKNNDGSAFEFSYDNSTENLEKTKEDIEKQTSISGSEFTEMELGIIDSLIENGANFEYYTEEDLHCLLPFIKAEAATQNLDLRKNTEKFGEKEQIADNYVPRKIEDLAENEVPGVILVQRTNTSGTTTILEYIDKEIFDKYVAESNMDVINKFTINDQGYLVYAEWSRIQVEVSGEYPEELEDSQKDTNQDTYFIYEREIDYTQLVAKYSMPFEFLLQLLANTKEPNFCMNLVNYALSSKIVINIQEEETVTVTTEDKIYDIYYKEEKKIDYEFTPNIEKKTDYLIRTKGENVIIDDTQTDCTKDDEKNVCTVYNYRQTTEPVIITTTRTEHTYKWELLEADTWVAHYKKEYKIPQDVIVTQPIVNEPTEQLDTYKVITEKENTLENSNDILNDAHAQKFKQLKEEYYKNKVAVPVVSVTKSNEPASTTGPAPSTTPNPNANTSTNSDTWKINVKDIGSKFNTSIDINKTYDNLPSEFNVTTIKTQNSIGGVIYKYKLNTSNEYYLESSNIKCNISKLSIKPYNKVNTKITTNETVTKWPADSNPITTTHIYAINEETGEFEKFLAAYDKSPGAQNQLNSIEDWLFEMMEKRESTVEFVDIIKYLLYMYDGQDRGVTDLEELKELFKPEEFKTIAGSYYGTSVEEKLWWALIDAGYSKEAAAGVMGNIKAESSFNCKNLEGSFETGGKNSIGYTDETYTDAINDGTYTREQFISDHYKDNCGAGYGLAQWTWNTRKAGLYDYAKEKGVGIDDVNMQIEYLLAELSPDGGANGKATYQLNPNEGYTADDWEDAETPEEAAEIFCWLFERPEIPHMDNRKKYASEFYEEYKDKTKPTFSGDTYIAAGYEFPHYNQKEYQEIYCSICPGRTIAAAGCGPTSMAMIVSGLLNNPSITPVTYIEELRKEWPNDEYHVHVSEEYPDGGGSNYYVWSAEFLKEHYGLTVETAESADKALEALKQRLSSFRW